MMQLRRLLVTGAGRLPPSARRILNMARGIETPAVVERPAGNRVLVLAPHPDDELIGCGGTVLKHVGAGADVTIAFVTSGEASAGLASLPAGERRARREAEAHKAAAVLGLGRDRLLFLRRRDGGSEEIELGPMLDQVAPDLVYAPFPFDSHADHRATAVALAGALEERKRIRVALYEVWAPLPANTIVDITEQLETKLAALACYTSALAAVDYLHTARGLAAYRSAQGLRGRGYAEAFTVLSAPELRALVQDAG